MIPLLHIFKMKEVLYPSFKYFLYYPSLFSLLKLFPSPLYFNNGSFHRITNLVLLPLVHLWCSCFVSGREYCKCKVTVSFVYLSYFRSRSCDRYLTGSFRRTNLLWTSSRLTWGPFLTSSLIRFVSLGVYGSDIPLYELYKVIVVHWLTQTLPYSFRFLYSCVSVSSLVACLILPVSFLKLK